MSSLLAFKEKFKELTASKEGAKLLIQTFKDGGVEINTPLCLSSGELYHFSTVIQLDADIINYIPKIDDVSLQLNASNIKRALRKHWYEVEFTFFKLKTNHTFWYTLADVLLIVVNLISILCMIEFDFQNIFQMVLNLILPSVSIYFRKKIQEYVSPYLIRGGFKLYKLLEPFIKKIAF